MTHQGTCTVCGWEGTVTRYQRFPDRTMTKDLCFTCERTPAGGLADLTSDRRTNDVIRMLAYCTQLILAAIEEKSQNA